MRFIHRSANDFLIEGEQGLAVLHACGTSEQEALQRLMLACATAFFINDSDDLLRAPFLFARKIGGDLWTSFEKSIVDTIVVNVLAREPDLRPLPRWVAIATDGRLSQSFVDVICPELLQFNHQALQYAVHYALLPYLKAKLSTAGPDIARSMAGLTMMCLLLGTRLDPRCAKFAIILDPYLSWTTEFTLCYVVDPSKSASFCVTRSL